MLLDDDLALRGLLTRFIADTGFGPTTRALATAAKRSPPEIEASLLRLADAHALLLHPGTTKPWVVHPFALSPGSCWVESPARGYWANCLYCAFGILAALGQDGVVTTRLGGERETVRYEIRQGRPTTSSDVFHLSTPVARWWDNVIYACASFQPFRREEDIDPWCERHAMPRGAILSIEQLWSFAGDWYGAYLSRPWRKRSPEELRALFTGQGLVGPFWSVDA